MEVYGITTNCKLITCARNENNWRYDIVGQSRNNITRVEIQISETAGSEERDGYLTHTWFDSETGLATTN